MVIPRQPPKAAQYRVARNLLSATVESCWGKESFACQQQRHVIFCFVRNTTRQESGVFFVKKDMPLLVNHIVWYCKNRTLHALLIIIMGKRQVFGLPAQSFARSQAEANFTAKVFNCNRKSHDSFVHILFIHSLLHQRNALT
mmetsp:Transcript_14094/g.27005  ORF Transcript_14094/g.27005 Transcript_14094/m.27005 type:complete len:142 (+) Transcript_14094:1746-2171(+)